MTIAGNDWIVILTGLAAIAWVNWYFFIAEREPTLAVAAPTSGAGLQEDDHAPGRAPR